LKRDGSAAIADFGLAEDVQGSAIEDEVVRGFRGTYNYAAPEAIRDGKLTWKSDVWSLGIVFLELLLNLKRPYFDFDTMEQCKEAICRENFCYRSITTNFVLLKETKMLEARLLLSKVRTTLSIIATRADHPADVGNQS